MSNYGARPALLFEFRRDAQVYRYTAADRPLVVEGNTYAAHPIKCGEFRFTGDSQADELSITVPASLPLVQDFTLTPPQSRLEAAVLRYHVGQSPVVRWSGFVDRVVQNTKLKATVICTSLLAGLQSNGARLIWQRQCPHAVYSPGCGVNKGAFAVTGVVTAVSGSAIVAAGLAAAGEGRLAAGFIEWTTPAGHKMRRVVNQHGTDFAEILGGTQGIEVGTTVVAYPGCGRSPEACAQFNTAGFTAENRYGGFRHLPSKSPFNGDPVF
jgi:uncharacterized phage protein (TIGR02218 family)